jgi:hypothetical protein
MKILTKEEESQHYRATVLGGTLAGAAGLVVGVAGVAAASRRYHFMCASHSSTPTFPIPSFPPLHVLKPMLTLTASKHLTVPLKAFLVTSTGTFAGIVGADHASRSYESARNPIDVEFREREARQAQAERANKTFTERAMDFGKKERYKIVGVSWLASMGIAFSLVNRNKYLTGTQKLVQARVYAQFLTLAVLVASAAFEISDSKKQQGRWETVRYVDPKDPEHKRMLEKKEFKQGDNEDGGHGQGAADDLWKEMVASEEERLRERDAEDAKYRKKNGTGHGKDSKGGKKSTKGTDEAKDKDADKDKNSKK